MTHLQQRIWRWHFYAGLLSLPIAILLSITGTIYVFKPQIEQWQDNSIYRSAEALQKDSILSADELYAAALNHYPEAKLKRYLLPKPGDVAAKIELVIKGQKHMLWLHRNSGEILYKTPSDSQFLSIVKNLHGELLAGSNGSYVVEFVASWMIVLIVSGIYLYWPTNRSQSFSVTLRDILLPRFRGVPKRTMLRNLHGSVGLWFSLLILVFLLTGLPWTQLWGNGFKKIQNTMQWGGPGQEWRITLKSGDKPSATAPKSDGLDLWSIDGNEGDVVLQSTPQVQGKRVSMQSIVNKPEVHVLAHPVQLQAPKADNGVWTVRSMTAYRPDRVTLHYDQWTGEPIMRIGFEDYHPVKQTVSYGIALHEGALFGFLNQILAATIAMSLVVLSISGALMWWQRRPKGKLAAPKRTVNGKASTGVVLITLVLAAFLPMVAIGFILVISIELLRISAASLIGSDPTK